MIAVLLAVISNNCTATFGDKMHPITSAISNVFQGAFAITAFIVDTMTNLKMVESTTSNQNFRNMSYSKNWLGQTLQSLGYKRQIYCYFWILLVTSITNVIIALISLVVSFEAQKRLIVEFFAISMGPPIHMFFTFKILDLFLVAIKKPEVVVSPTRRGMAIGEMCEAADSRLNSISFFKSVGGEPTDVDDIAPVPDIVLEDRF